MTQLGSETQSAHYFYRIKNFAILLKETDADDDFFIRVHAYVRVCGCWLACWATKDKHTYFLPPSSRNSQYFFSPTFVYWFSSCWYFKCDFFQHKHSFFFLNQLIFRQYMEFERLVIGVYAEGDRGDILPMEFSNFNKSTWMMIKSNTTTYTHRHSSFYWLRTEVDCVLRKERDMFFFMISLFFFTQRFPMTHDLELWKISLLHSFIMYYDMNMRRPDSLSCTKAKENEYVCLCWPMDAYAKCVKTTTATTTIGVVFKSHCTQF